MRKRDLKNCIRDIPDFPKQGVIFKDITTLLMNGDAWKEAVSAICDPYRENPPDIVVGIEAICPDRIH